jgi:hypothetical protein
VRRSKGFEFFTRQDNKKNKKSNTLEQRERFIEQLSQKLTTIKAEEDKKMLTPLEDTFYKDLFMALILSTIPVFFIAGVIALAKLLYLKFILT